MNEAIPKSPTSPGTMLIILGVGALGLLFALLIRQGVPPQKRGGLEPGNPLPPLRAAGWLNGTAPAADSLRGKVLVVNAWATWCIQCRKAAPEHVEIQKKFAGRDVQFISLTTEGAEVLPEIQEYLDSNGITWLNGYGVADTLVALKADYIPCVWVVNRNGTIVWNEDSGGTLERAIETALASSG